MDRVSADRKFGFALSNLTMSKLWRCTFLAPSIVFLFDGRFNGSDFDANTHTDYNTNHKTDAIPIDFSNSPSNQLTIVKLWHSCNEIFSALLFRDATWYKETKPSCLAVIYRSLRKCEVSFGLIFMQVWNVCFFCVLVDGSWYRSMKTDWRCSRKLLQFWDLGNRKNGILFTQALLVDSRILPFLVRHQNSLLKDRHHLQPYSQLKGNIHNPFHSYFVKFFHVHM